MLSLWDFPSEVYVQDANWDGLPKVSATIFATALHGQLL